MENETEIKLVISKTFRKLSMIVLAISIAVFMAIAIVLFIVAQNVSDELTFGVMIEFGVILILCACLSPLGLWCDNRRRTLTDVTVTEKVIIGYYVGYNPFRRKPLNLSLDNITDVSAIENILDTFNGNRVRIQSTTGKIVILFVENADEVVAFLKNAMQKAKEQGVSSYAEEESHPQRSQNEIADNLKKIADLRDAGIITEEEFEQKKKELLGKM